MKFLSYQIRGKGRGKVIGIPTINLQIPEGLNLDDGIYAVLVRIGRESFKGVIHFGPVPVFAETEKTLEVLLIDIHEAHFPKTENIEIEVEIKKRLREVRNFTSTYELVNQVKDDILKAREYLINK